MPFLPNTDRIDPFQVIAPVVEKALAPVAVPVAHGYGHGVALGHGGLALGGYGHGGLY